ncbi:hypothetical protein SAMN04490202_2316 [Pseudomonas reinekei]|uniref:Uncharacterized protein n=1 Tax=Pseudomonas reinekei TaxID=395598 RepID=A0A1H0NN99_PSERE|nr:hypothetical protein SAMN04490202_2316 [Pseudomonas reinekei]
MKQKRGSVKSTFIDQARTKNPEPVAVLFS